MKRTNEKIDEIEKQKKTDQDKTKQRDKDKQTIRNNDIRGTVVGVAVQATLIGLFKSRKRITNAILFSKFRKDIKQYKTCPLPTFSTPFINITIDTKQHNC